MIECSICMESLMSIGPVCAIICGHLFHRDCLSHLTKKHCPLCRRPFIRYLNLFFNNGYENDSINLPLLPIEEENVKIENDQRKMDQIMEKRKIDQDKNGENLSILMELDYDKIREEIKALKKISKESEERNLQSNIHIQELESNLNQVTFDCNLLRKESLNLRSKVKKFEDKFDNLNMENKSLSHRIIELNSMIEELKSIQTSVTIGEIIKEIDSDNVKTLCESIQMDSEQLHKSFAYLSIKHSEQQKEISDLNEKLRKETIEKEQLKRIMKHVKRKENENEKGNGNGCSDNFKINTNPMKISNGKKLNELQNKSKKALIYPSFPSSNLSLLPSLSLTNSLHKEQEKKEIEKENIGKNIKENKFLDKITPPSTFTKLSNYGLLESDGMGGHRRVIPSSKRPDRNFHI